MKFTIISVCMMLTTLGYSQDIIIPEEISKNCPDIPLKDRVRVTVAEFANSTKGVKDKNIDNFSSMLSNALFKVNCYRVISMKKDNDLLEGVQARALKPQAVVTGEITEYFHNTSSKKLLMKTIETTTAHIGLILQVRNNHSGDILFSESINKVGSSENSALQTVVKLPGRVGKVLGPQTVSAKENGNIEAAYQDALEKAILATVALMVEENARLVINLRENLPENYDSIVQSGNTAAEKSVVITLVVQNASFKNLLELENKYKASSWVSSVAKSLVNGVGQLKIAHHGNQEDLLNMILTFGKTFEITGLDEKIISIKENKI